MRIDEIDTPALVVDLDVMEANLRTYQAYFDAHGIGLRPHIKTHKIPALAQRQIAAGAIGITCAKLGEAEVMADAGLDDILLYFNILGPSKLERLGRLAQRCALTTTADNLTVAEALAECGARYGTPIRTLAELGSFNQRTGAPTVSQLVALAQFIDRSPHLRLMGIATYPSGPDNRARLQAAGDAFQASGLCLDVVSGGGTPYAFEAHREPRLSEYRIGTYLFQDKIGIDKGYGRVASCALQVATTVVSRPAPERAIVDGGTKTFSSDGGLPIGQVVNYPEAVLYNANEEHGYLDVARCPEPPAVGARVWVIPNHACGAMNMHDRAYGVRQGWVQETWDIAARGKVS